MPKPFAVPVVYRGQSNFIVEAETPEEAKRLAEEKFKNGNLPDAFGNEWEEIEKVCDPEEVPQRKG
jgi:hypothetical protein